MTMAARVAGPGERRDLSTARYGREDGGRLVAGWGGDHDGVGVDFGNAQVAGEVEQIEGADGAGDLDNVHAARAAEHNGKVADFGAFVVEPEIGEV